MAGTYRPNERVGWELIWRHGNAHPRYGSFAAPDAAVTEWAATLPPGGLVLDLGCGVGRHVVDLGGRGFRMAGIDISPTGLRLTREACAERGISFEGRRDGPNCDIARATIGGRDALGRKPQGAGTAVHHYQDVGHGAACHREFQHQRN
jgi:SAM-dependent methyltransferase